jgi:hypothetical protein
MRPALAKANTARISDTFSVDVSPKVALRSGRIVSRLEPYFPWIKPQNRSQSERCVGNVVINAGSG